VGAVDGDRLSEEAIEALLPGFARADDAIDDAIDDASDDAIGHDLGDGDEDVRVAPGVNATYGEAGAVKADAMTGAVRPTGVPAGVSFVVDDYEG
jgi:hypothetical protein